MADSEQTLELLSYRRRVEESYARVRASEGPRARDRWATDRDRLFKDHPQSPLSVESRSTFEGLSYFPYDPSLRFTPTMQPVDGNDVRVGHSAEGTTSFRRFGAVRFDLDGGSVVLSLFWLEGYVGGIFVPFRDATSGRETYGGGRYLLDSAKGADLGSDGDRIVLDFNFAYHPSCVHDDRWSCPLAPPENRFAVPIRGGERLPRV